MGFGQILGHPLGSCVILVKFPYLFETYFAYLSVCACLMGWWILPWFMFIGHLEKYLALDKY